MHPHKVLINAKLEGKITHIAPHQMQIRLSDGSRCVLKEREFAWDEQDKLRWLSQATVGNKIEVKAIRYDSQEQLEVSRRMILNDPWDTITDRYCVGSVVRGIVESIYEGDIFVGLEPGVTGIVRLKDQGEHRGKQVTDTFWNKDFVYAIVQNLSPEKRELGLSFDQIRTHRWSDKVSLSQKKKVQQVYKELLNEERKAQADTTGLFYHEIIIYDDDSEFRKQLYSFFTHHGHSTHCVVSVTEAEQKLATYSNKQKVVAIFDHQMPVEHGDCAIERLQLLYPQVIFILVTQAINHHANEKLEDLGVHVMLKPTQPKEFPTFCQDILTHVTRQDRTSSAPTVQMRMSKTIMPALQFDPTQRITALLEQAQNYAKANNAVLLKVIGDNEAVEVVKYTNLALHTEQSNSLIHSPIKNVVQTAIPYICINAYKQDAEVRHLRNAIVFEACIGIPIITPLADKYCFFLFFDTIKEDGGLQNDHKLSSFFNILLIIGSSIGSALEQMALVEQIESKQRMATAGELTSAIMHDINAQIGELNRAPEHFREVANRLQTDIGNNPKDVARLLDYLKNLVSGFEYSFRVIAKTSALYNQLSLKSEKQYQRIDEVVRQAVELSKSMADDQGVRIKYIPPDHLVIGKVHRTRLMHILQNVLLNAVQQIKLENNKREGIVHVNLRTAPIVAEGQPRVVYQIRIEDDGPGIHSRNFENIFNLGITTRKNAGGSGIGLYMARTLAHQLGGTIIVESSAIGWGSCFLIQLPCE